jgi:hypothetical protein
LIISDEMWDILAPSTEPYEDITREDLESGLESGEFVMFKGENSIAVTCSYGSSLRVGLAGGDLDELLDIEKSICSYAREKGFASVEIIGRPGWERVLPNYERTAVLLRKELNHGLH